MEKIFKEVERQGKIKKSEITSLGAGDVVLKYDDLKDFFKAQQALLLEVKNLTDTIVNSKPDMTIKGDIESRALFLGHHTWVLNARLYEFN